MIEGRVASADELDAARDQALQTASAEIGAAIEAGAADAHSTFVAIPPWARVLLEPTQLAALKASAAEHVPPTPERVVQSPFGAFWWEDDIASYVTERPLSVGAVSLSLADVDAEGVAERLGAHAWVEDRREEVVEAARHYAAEQGLEMQRRLRGSRRGTVVRGATNLERRG